MTKQIKVYPMELYELVLYDGCKKAFALWPDGDISTDSIAALYGTKKAEYLRN
jgi:hypothetical protein